MESPASHGPDDMPFFAYLIFRGNSFADLLPWNIIKVEKFIANSSNPYFNTAGGGSVVWRDWTTECIDLSSYLNDEVSILFVTADCALSAHYGYAYIDGLCEPHEADAKFMIDDDICIDDPILADGSASQWESDHFWSIQESDEYWTPIGLEYSQWYVGEAGVFDLSTFLLSQGGELKCNTYYRVKLAVKNDCTPWDDETKLIYIRCPDVEPLQDKIVCCGQKTVNFGWRDRPDNTYSWSVDPPSALISTAGSSVTIDALNNATVSVVVTDNYGCSHTYSANLWVLTKPQLDITVEKEDCCTTIFDVDVEFDSRVCNNPLSADDYETMVELLDFQWNNGETGQSIAIDDENDGYYYVDVTAPKCGDDTIGGWHYAGPHNSGVTFPPTIGSNAFYLNGPDPLTNKLIIYEFGGGAPLPGESPAYGAVAYMLRIFNRWDGGMVNEIIVDNRDCLYQGQITWDGKDMYGNWVLAPDVYVFTLYMKDCNDGSWTKICNLDQPTATGDCWKECFSLNGSIWPWNWGWVCCEEWDPCTYKVSAID